MRADGPVSAALDSDQEVWVQIPGFTKDQVCVHCVASCLTGGNAVCLHGSFASFFIFPLAWLWEIHAINFYLFSAFICNRERSLPLGCPSP